MSKAPKINSPPRKTWLPAHGSSITLASQLSNASSRSSLGGLSGGPKLTRSSTSQRLRPRTMANVPSEAGKLHKLGSMPAYLRRIRPASSPAEVESKPEGELKLEQLDSGVGGEQLDSGVEVATGRPEGSTELEAKPEPLVEEAKKEEPKPIPLKRIRVGAAKVPANLEQNEAFRRLTNRVGELETELAQKNVEYATLVQSNASLVQDNATMASRVEALEKLLTPPKETASMERPEAVDFREAMQANIRKQDEALVGLRNMLLNSVVANDRFGKPEKLDEPTLRALVKQMQESSQEMRQLVKNNRQLSEEFIGENAVAQADKNMQNMLDLGLGEIVTGRIVYD